MPRSGTVLAKAATPVWQPVAPVFDGGPAPRAAIGVIALATDAATESDFALFLRQVGVGYYVSRVRMATLANRAALNDLQHHLRHAVELLVPGTPLAVVTFSCTTGSIALGPTAIAACIHGLRPGVRVVNPVDAAIDGIGRLGCQRVAVLAPYLDEVSEILGAYMGERGLHITAAASFKQRGDPEMNRIAPDCILETAARLASDDCEAVFISCTGLRTATIIQRLEDRIGKPVVTSNQAQAWASLRAAGIVEPQAGFGRLFTI